MTTMNPDNGTKLERRVVRAAEAALAKRQFVTAIDVLVGIGWLMPSLVEEWRQGRVEYLERVTQANESGTNWGRHMRVVWRQRRGHDSA